MTSTMLECNDMRRFLCETGEQGHSSRAATNNSDFLTGEEEHKDLVEILGNKGDSDVVEEERYRRAVCGARGSRGGD